MERRRLLGIAPPVRYPDTNVHVQFLLAAVNHLVDMRSYLAPDDSPDKTHQALRLPKFAATDGLYHDEKSIVDLVVQLLGSQLTAQVIADALGEKLVQLLHTGLFPVVDAFHQIGPVYLIV